MKRWKIIALACAIVAAMGIALTGCNSETYTPAGKSQAVSASALGKDGVLRVGVNASSAPLAGKTSSSSRIVGIDVDVAAYLADELGLKVEVADVGSDPAKALKDGLVDVVLGVDASESEADYWRSSSYIETGVALFSAAAETSIPAVDSNPKIAAQASSKSSWRVTNLFGDDALVAQSDLKSAFAALSGGDVRYVAADAVIGTYVAYSSGYNDKIIALLQDPSGYCAAVSGTNAELQSALGAAVTKLINGGMMNVIELKWLGEVIDLENTTIVKASASGKQDSDEGGEESAEGDGAAEEGAEGDAEDAGGAVEADLSEEAPVADESTATEDAAGEAA